MYYITVILDGGKRRAFIVSLIMFHLVPLQSLHQSVSFSSDLKALKVLQKCFRSDLVILSS